MRRTSPTGLTAAILSALIPGLILCLSVVQTANADEQSIHASDRAAILAMAGDYAVTFDFHETVALQQDYALKDRYTAHAEEIIRVIQNDDDRISLQHLLVAEKDGVPMTIKHWRQDWVFQPTQVLEYKGDDRWDVRDLDADEAKGAWSQAVYQVDDSPRYAALGQWRHDGGVSRWTSEETWRPLPRRDATKRDDYDVMVSVNRHTLTPTGWVHEQDNAKLALRNRTEQTIAHEIGTNAYVHSDAFDASHAEAYWEETKAYWETVRAAWNTIERDASSVTLVQPYEGESLWDRLLEIADEIQSGEINADAAILEANTLIKTHAKVVSRQDGQQQSAQEISK